MWSHGPADRCSLAYTVVWIKWLTKREHRHCKPAMYSVKVSLPSPLLPATHSPTGGNLNFLYVHSPEDRFCIDKHTQRRHMYSYSFFSLTHMETDYAFGSASFFFYLIIYLGHIIIIKFI